MGDVAVDNDGSLERSADLLRLRLELYRFSSSANRNSSFRISSSRNSSSTSRISET